MYEMLLKVRYLTVIPSDLLFHATSITEIVFQSSANEGSLIPNVARLDMRDVISEFLCAANE